MADVQRVAGSSLIFRDYPSRPAAFHAIDLQHVGALVLTLLVGPVLHRLVLPVAETWRLVGLQLITAAAFASAMALAAGRWALVPTWVLFIVLGKHLVRWGRLAAPAAAAVRAHLAVVAVGCDRHRLAQRRSTPTSTYNR